MPNTTNNSTQSMINSYLNLASHDPESINTAHSPKDKETLSDEDNSSSSSESESLPHDGLSTLSSPAPTVVVPFKCIVGYSLQLEDRKRGHKLTWEAAKSPAATKMYIDVNHNKQSFEEFKIAAADVCNTLLPGIGLMIGKAGKKNIPKIEWQAFIPNNKGGNLARCTLEAQPLIIDGLCNHVRSPYCNSIFLSQLNPKQKKNQTHKENLIAKTNIRLEAAAAKSGSSHQAVNDDNSKEDYSDNEGSIIKEIDLYTDRDQILKRYGVGCRYNQIFPSFLHPTEITKYIPLSAEKIHIWANALLEKKSGVSIDSPPSEFHCKVRQKAGAAAELAPPPPPNPETTAMNAALTVWNYSLGNGAWKGMSA
ncbi:hypothetical protein PSTG_14074 [Puccinia striiformis f. sp. tritici PST-78]|uniref:Uncharacterized protein n=1 Tax=Puccinia striiformis f. sp. tritici PST-78 TaxID=1165861 RepID=A0A0L0V0N8_9BASI|nr:hypothetical protein PSTG_14074 [Puccinia striiformis f. sp. tritici PST-78]